MIIKNLLNKIYIHPSCYLFLLLAVLSSNFISSFFACLLLIIHELGHFLTAIIFKWPTDKIIFYPFGAISKFYHEINCPLSEEMIVLVMGPIVQIVFYIFISNFNFFGNYYELFTYIHYSILIFNLLPIYPLDGGRILQCLISYFTSYNLSFKIIFLLSYIFIIVFFILFLINPGINLLFIIVFLFLKLLIEYKNIKFYFERFLLERYLYNYKFRKSTIVNSTLDFKRNYKHLVMDNKKYFFEKEYLSKKYNC